MMTIQDLIDELKGFDDKSAVVKVEVEHVEGHDVVVTKNDIHALKFENDEVVVELG